MNSLLIDVLSHVPRSTSVSLGEMHGDLDYVANDIPYIQVCGSIKSGTSLMHTLFDSHPQVITYPHESGLTGEYFYKMTEARTAGELFKLFVNLHKYYLPAVGGKSKSKVSIPMIASTIANHRNVLPYANRDFWKLHASFLLAFLWSRQPNVTGSIWVDKSPMSHLHADFIAQRPMTKFIHMLRSPADNFSSIYPKVSRLRYPRRTILVILWRYLKFSIGSFRACIRNKNKFGDRYFVLPYEQLVQNPVDIMTSVCELCGIEFADIILKPTELGNPYGGNNKEGRIFRGISNHGVGAWRSRMPDEFAMIMEHGREEEMTQLGYEPHFSVNQTRPIFEQFLDEIRAIKKRRLLGRYDERLFDDQSAAVGVSSVD